MANTVSVDPKALQEILTRLDKLNRDVEEIKEKLDEPTYGSDKWWELSDKKALKSIKQGKGTVIQNKKELNDFFKSLKKA